MLHRKTGSSSSSSSRKLCTNCGQNKYNRDKSKIEKLCVSCLKKLPRVECYYCQTDFHQKDNDKGVDGHTVCEDCLKNLQTNKDPARCKYCTVQAAFSGPTCQHCTKYQEKYGQPIACERCQLQAAFLKPMQSIQKVDNKRLCLLCTRLVKRQLYEENRKLKKQLESAEDNSSGKKRPRIGRSQSSGAAGETLSSNHDVDISELFAYTTNNNSSNNGMDVVMKDDDYSETDLNEFKHKYHKMLATIEKDSEFRESTLRRQVDRLNATVDELKKKVESQQRTIVQKEGELEVLHEKLVVFDKSSKSRYEELKQDYDEAMSQLTKMKRIIANIDKQ